jgi:predicted deacylase
MTKVYSKALDQTIEVDRLIGQCKGSLPGPSIIFTAGIHGNEPSGVFALQQVLEEIQQKNLQLKGNIYAIAGNLWALEKEHRFHKEDLNRIWTSERMDQLKDENLSTENEDIKQQLEIFNLTKSILETDAGPFYFIDLHTTSCTTSPFLTVNDSLLNRKFTQQYPVPIILGIEEYLDGPFLSYINEQGYVALGFEAGQHDAVESIENHKAFIYLSLLQTGVISRKDVDFDHYFQLLTQASTGTQGLYEIIYRYEIKPNEQFVMQPGFLNFEFVNKGQVLAENNDGPIIASYRARVFMPLYQSQGNDGFFAIRTIRPFYLRLSAILRRWHFDRILPLLPGVRWASKKRDTLVVNRRIARLFPKQFVHLLGYRSRRLDKTHLVVKNRESVSKHEEYRNEVWYSTKSNKK